MGDEIGKVKPGEKPDGEKAKDAAKVELVKEALRLALGASGLMRAPSNDPERPFEQPKEKNGLSAKAAKEISKETFRLAIGASGLYSKLHTNPPEEKPDPKR